MQESTYDITQSSNQPGQVFFWNTYCKTSIDRYRTPSCVALWKEIYSPKITKSVWQHSIHHNQFQDFLGFKHIQTNTWWPLNQPFHPMVAINPSAITRLLPQAGAVTRGHRYRKGRRCHGLREPRVHLWPRRCHRLLAKVGSVQN